MLRAPCGPWRCWKHGKHRRDQSNLISIRSEFEWPGCMARPSPPSGPRQPPSPLRPPPLCAFVFFQDFFFFVMSGLLSLAGRCQEDHGKRQYHGCRILWQQLDKFSSKWKWSYKMKPRYLFVLKNKFEGTERCWHDTRVTRVLLPNLNPKGSRMCFRWVLMNLDNSWCAFFTYMTGSGLKFEAV